MTTEIRYVLGCARHRVSVEEVEARWLLPATIGHPRLAMCRCCYGPALVDEFDVWGIGRGEMLCSRCQQPARYG